MKIIGTARIITVQLAIANVYLIPSGHAKQLNEAAAIEQNR